MQLAEVKVTHAVGTYFKMTKQYLNFFQNRRPVFQRQTLLVIFICVVLVTAEYSLSVMQKLGKFFMVLHEVLSQFRPTIR